MDRAWLRAQDIDIAAEATMSIVVPDPARFALHTLIVAGERGAAMHARRDKELHQAREVLGVLVEERPGDVRLAGGAVRSATVSRR